MNVLNVPELSPLAEKNVIHCSEYLTPFLSSMLMADLLTHPTRSIVTQSYASRERLYQNPTNGDG